MKKEIADQWVAALRSGKYRQGTNRLRNRDDFCCLGVLCDLSPVEGKDIPSDPRFQYAGEAYDLPQEVMAWAGVRSRYGRLIANFPGYSLGRVREGVTLKDLTLQALNDSWGFSFKEIADVIEENWEYL